MLTFFNKGILSHALKLILLIIQFFYGITAWAVVLNSPDLNLDESEKIAFRYLQGNVQTLDPQESYDERNIYLVRQIYEQLYNINYVKNHLKIQPLLASDLPHLQYLDFQGNLMEPSDETEIAYTIYTIPLKKNIFYQPHPAFCHKHILAMCQGIKRELKAMDFVYAFERTANKKVNSPIVSLLSKHIEGYEDFLTHKTPHIKGVTALDNYTLQIVTKGHYAQFIYWLGMPLLAPIPIEVDVYNEKMDNKEAWRWFSVGTGAFMLFNDKNYQKITLLKNPHFRKEIIQENTLDDKNYKKYIGKQVPMIDRIEFIIEKESIPRWNKFLQGYYDLSSIPSETFEKVVWTGPSNQIKISPILEKQNIKLSHYSTYGISGLSFNMLDKTVGGLSQQSRYLRQAITIALNVEEYINIFENVMTQQSQGPLPQIILDSENIDGFNPYIFDKSDKYWVRKPLSDAKKLLSLAGYKKGIDPKTHQPLVLTLDVVSSGNPTDKAVFNWYRKRLGLLGIQLDVRENDKNRLNFILEHGRHQMTLNGWIADYPDAESFFMLFYSKNGKKDFLGPNISNYSNSEYDALYEELANPLRTSQRYDIETKLYQILIRDAVWSWGVNSQLIFLGYQWFEYTIDTSPFVSGSSKYYALNTALRKKMQKHMNQANFKPLIFIVLSLMIFLIPFILEWIKFNKSKAKRTTF